MENNYQKEGFSVRSLSDYENWKTKVPDYIVDAMAEIYKMPLLAWWHVKKTSPLGKYFPDIQEPQTNGDVYLQSDFAGDEVTLVKTMLKEFFRDGVLTEDEYQSYQSMREKARRAAGKLMSIYTFEPQFEPTERSKS